MYGRYQAYYKKIQSELEEIKDEQGYSNKSKAFAHWYLENTKNLDEQDIAESIIDNHGDNGIDVIRIEEDVLEIYQFKFPDREKNIDKSIDEKTVQKIFNGYNKLVGNRKPTYANENFLKYRELVKNRNIFTYKFYFVVFNKSFSAPAQDTLESEVEKINESTGNRILHQVIQEKDICDIYDRIQKKSKIDLQLNYKKFDTSYNIDEDVKSSVGFCSAIELINSCKDVMDVIFDENIRLYSGNNSVNEKIYETSKGDDSSNFFFYHNGVVFICDRCKNSLGNQLLSLEGASVVNGCQTINSLKRAYDENLLKEDVFLQIRVIETTDFELRAKITEYLNSQTKIRDSYFLANNSFIRALQSDLEQKGYFLERLANEYSYKFSLGKIKKYEKKNIIKLENAIQIFTAFYFNEYAAKAKSGKNELFDKKIIEKIISEINTSKLLHSISWYEKIKKIMATYRKCLRAKVHKTDFFDIMDLHVLDEDFSEQLKKYAFMNTADLLILNTVANLQNSVNYADEEEYLVDAINIIRKKADMTDLLPYQLTKNNGIFVEIQNEIKGEYQ